MRPDFHILLIEDSRADVKIIERALREGNIPHRLTVIHDGRQALDYLDQLARPRRRRRRSSPTSILLDLNLPGIDGCQVLTQIKSRPLPAGHPGRRPDHLPARRGRAPDLPGRRQHLHPEARRIPPLPRPGQDPPPYWHETALRPPLSKGH